MKRVISTISAAVAAVLWVLPSVLWLGDGDIVKGVSSIAVATLMAAIAVLIWLDQPQGYASENPSDKEIKIEIKYFTDEIDKIDYVGGTEKSNWIDLRAAEEVSLQAGETKLIPLGVGMKLPQGYEAHIVPRSSTHKNYGIIQANHFGVIDNSYCGDGDQWMFPAYALRDTTIHINDRICQFRIEKNQPVISFIEVNRLYDANRGGIGSTGK